MGNMMASTVAFARDELVAPCAHHQIDNQSQEMISDHFFWCAFFGPCGFYSFRVGAGRKLNLNMKLIKGLHIL